MNFSFELSGALLTGNINQDAMMGMGAVMGAVFGGLTVIRATILFGLAVLMIISRWKIFKKAGFPGWGILVPVYNRTLMFKLGGLSGRWALSIFFPPLFAIMMIINMFRIPTRFGKDWTFGLGIIFLKIIFIPILAFDDSKYLNKKRTNTPAHTNTPVAKKITQTPTKKVIIKKSPTKKTITKAPTKTIITKKAPTKKAPTKKK